MIKSILVGLDGSQPSMAALEQAAKWAPRLKAELRGLFVEDEQRFLYYPSGFSAEGGMPVSSPLPGEEMAAENERVKAEGDRLREAFEKALAAHSLQGQFIQLRGNVNQILTRQARAVDLVVVGRRGSNDPAGSKETGPTTESLIHNALRPTMVVPEEPTGNGSIVYAYDGSRGAHRVLPSITEMAMTNGGMISVISIGEEPALKAEHEEVLRRYWEPYGIGFSFRFTRREGRISSMIVEHARQENAGVIAMGAFGHNPLHELFFGSTTLETIAHATCPVLLMA